MRGPCYFNRRGAIFFDDMDLALRDREKGAETEDQAIVLTALDGIRATEGVAFVFTTNCSLELLDRAFKRPGRIDVVLHFKSPNATLRRQLIRRRRTTRRRSLLWVLRSLRDRGSARHYSSRRRVTPTEAGAPDAQQVQRLSFFTSTSPTHFQSRFARRHPRADLGVPALKVARWQAAGDDHGVNCGDREQGEQAQPASHGFPHLYGSRGRRYRSGPLIARRSPGIAAAAGTPR